MSWQLVAYGHRSVSTSSVEALCAGWSDLFVHTVRIVHTVDPVHSANEGEGPNGG